MESKHGPEDPNSDPPEHPKEESNPGSGRGFRALLALYTFLYTLGVLSYLPVFFYRVLFQGKRGIPLGQRLGRVPSGLGAGEEGAGSFRIWVHAVSVGEVNAVRPLVETLQPAGHQILLSTTTETGQGLARHLFRERARVFYFPLDWKWTCRRYLKTLRPHLVLLAETELWPNFIASTHELEIPILLVNGRLSDGSFRRYRRIRFFLRPLFQRMSHFCMQSRQDKERILELGAPPSQVNWVGNLKFDYEPESTPELGQVVDSLGQLLQPAGNEPVWVCGSTREGEEAKLLRVFVSLRQQFPGLRVLLAPRHPHRTPEVVRLLQQMKLDYFLRSQLDPGNPPDQLSPPSVLVLDTIGELAQVYRLADVVFIGGSLVPTGGHNLIEPAAFSKPILVGPHMENFQEVLETFRRSYAVVQVRDEAELEQRLGDLLKDPYTRTWLGRNARKVIRENQGSVKRTTEIIRRHLPAQRSP